MEYIKWYACLYVSPRDMFTPVHLNADNFLNYFFAEKELSQASNEYLWF